MTSDTSSSKIVSIRMPKEILEMVRNDSKKSGQSVSKILIETYSHYRKEYFKLVNDELKKLL
jgi:predicted DNA-binding protein